MLDLGMAVENFCLQAADLGLGTCIMGWFDQEKVMEICKLDTPARLIITLGYPGEKEKLRIKKRKDMSELVTNLD